MFPLKNIADLHANLKNFNRETRELYSIHPSIFLIFLLSAAAAESLTYFLSNKTGMQKALK